MHAELQVLSPLVPIREVNFLRFCKQHAEGVWAVVDVSIDGIRELPMAGNGNTSCRRLPSGCLVQDMPNGYSKVPPTITLCTSQDSNLDTDQLQFHSKYKLMRASFSKFIDQVF